VNDEDDNNACSQVLDLIELLMGCAYIAIHVYARLPREQQDLYCQSKKKKTRDLPTLRFWSSKLPKLLKNTHFDEIYP
jgi:hypothetical protein